MEEKRSILVIGREEEAVEKITQMLSRNFYHAFSALTNEDALRSFMNNKIEVVIIGPGIDKESNNYFHDTFSRLDANVKLINAAQSTILEDLKNAFREENSFKYGSE